MGVGSITFEIESTGIDMSLVTVIIIEIVLKFSHDVLHFIKFVGNV